MLQKRRFQAPYSAAIPRKLSLKRHSEIIKTRCPERQRKIQLIKLNFRNHRISDVQSIQNPTVERCTSICAEISSVETKAETRLLFLSRSWAILGWKGRMEIRVERRNLKPLRRCFTPVIAQVRNQTLNIGSSAGLGAGAPWNFLRGAPALV